MKRYWRLLALVGVSLLLHILVIGMAASYWPPPGQTSAPSPPPPPLSLRLQPPADPDAPVGVAPAHETAAPAPATVPDPVVDAAPDAAAPAAPGARQPATEAEAEAAPQTAPQTAPLPLDADTPFQAPPRYRVRTPPSATLDYALTQPGGQQSTTRIAWQTDGSVYRVVADGVMGKLSSEGGIGDTGVEPKHGQIRHGDADVDVTFAAHEIAIDGKPYPNSIGSQDPASLLLQLAGMGIAAPPQMHDVVSVYVATADGPIVMRFQVTGEEDLPTPLGRFSTFHLAQLVQPGQARLEVWLAPQQRWLPVQLRLTAPDGAVSTQTVTSIAG